MATNPHMPMEVDPSRLLILLEAVELYGFGNWQDTATFAGDERPPEEIRDQYVSIFVDGNIGRVTWSSIDKQAFQITDHTSTGQIGQLSPSLTTPLPSIPELSLGEQQCLGYMPRRDDFEREFDNEVELLISNLRINPNEEDELDVDLKVAHIDMYNRRLKERFRKKSVVRDYGLVALFFKTISKDPDMRALLYPNNDTLSSNQSSTSLASTCNTRHGLGTSQVTNLQSNTPCKWEPKSTAGIGRGVTPNKKKTPVKCLQVASDTNTSSPNTTAVSHQNPLSPSSVPPSSPTSKGNRSSIFTPKQKEQMREKFKIFSQFHSALDQLQLFENLGREKELKSRIKELYRFRRNGLKSIHEVVSYELARAKNRGKKKKVSQNELKLVNSVFYGQFSQGLIAMKQMEGFDKKSDRSPSPKRAKVATPEQEENTTKPSLPSPKPKTPKRSKVVPKLTDPELSPLFQKSEIQRPSVTPLSNRSIKPLTKSPIVASQNRNRSLALNRDRISSIFSDGRDGRSPKGSVETTTLSGDDDDTATDNDELMSVGSSSRINCFNIDSMPGARLLSKSEKKICENLRLTPSFYINVKGMIIKEKSGPIPPSRRQRTVLDSVDGRIRRRVNDYLSRSGMLC